MKKLRKRKRPVLDNKLKIKLWTYAAGRCQYRGCNRRLNIDDITNRDINKAYIAHIYAFSEGGARYDENLSPKLEKCFSNLMLMCDECHRRIDIEDVLGHPAKLLIEMKKEHEDRILNLTSIKENVKTNLIIYTSIIGQIEPIIDVEVAKRVLAKNHLYPANNSIELGVKNTLLQDNEEFYWQQQVYNLEKNFDSFVLPLLKSSENKHFSLFAIAPQPLLIKLGTMMPDIYTVDIYQKHREPDTWEWQYQNKTFNGYQIKKPKNKSFQPALIISLSGKITEDRVENSLQEKVSIWEFTIKNPNNDFLKTKELLQDFRVEIRGILNEIKMRHGHNATLKVFPCMPISACIEFGRIWMPKSDMSLEIFDERNGFKKAITINRI